MGLNRAYKWTHEVQTLVVQGPISSVFDWEPTDVKG